jgi:glycerol uptake facilitator-like aquaporin
MQIDAPASVVPFVVAQLVGAALACVAVRVLWPRTDDRAHAVVVPHEAAEAGKANHN